MSELEELPSWAGRSVSNAPDGAGGQPAEAPMLAQRATGVPPQPQPQDEKRRRGPLFMFLLGFLGLLVLFGVGALGYLLAQSQNSTTTETADQEAGSQLGSEAATGADADGADAADTETETEIAATDDDGAAAGDTATDGADTDDGAGDDGNATADGTGDQADEETEEGAEGSDAADGTDPEADRVEEVGQFVGPPEGQYERYAVFKGGVVYLIGRVPSEEVGQIIQQKAAAVVGPDNVVNQYEIDPTSTIEEGGGAPLYVEDVVLFEFNSIEVATPFLPILDLGTLLLRQNPQASITVVTRTDAVGSEAVNLDVSTKRAQSVIDYWISSGVSRDQISADPRGEEGASEDDDPETAALNRRAEFIIAGLLD